MLTVVEADLVESFTLVAVTVAVAFCVAVQAVGIPAIPLFNLEIILLDYFRQVARCFVLLEAKFTEAENLVDHPLRKGLELIGFGNGLLLEHVEFGWRVWAREG